jgi:hypothetical protein
MKSVHLLLSATLLSAAAPFIEDQQFGEFHEQQLSQFEPQQQSNQLRRQRDPLTRQQVSQFRNEQQRLNELGASYD